jgi:phosphocarrier protein HPr
MSMQEVEVVIRHKVGLHARPAALFVQTANKFTSDLQVINGDLQANAKSILSVLALGAGEGAVVKLIASGEDEKNAVNTLRQLIEDNFGEEAGDG